MELNFPEKVNKIRESLASWQEDHGNEFNYVITEFSTENEETGEVKTYIREGEHREILKYLEDRCEIKLSDREGNGYRVSVLPKKEPAIKSKTLELISRDLKDHYTGTQIVDLLTECGVDERFIIYPQSKWFVFYLPLQELTTSGNPKDKELLFKVIVEAIHPLNLGGDSILSEVLSEKIGYYLGFDNLELSKASSSGTYKIYEVITEEEQNEIMKEDFERSIKEEEDTLKKLRKDENSERIALLRKSFQSFMGVVELYCSNPSKPTTELNDIYQFLKKSIWATIDELDLKKISGFYKFEYSKPPFTNLFSAEKEYRLERKILSWDRIRPELNDLYGAIDNLYQKLNGSDILSEPNKQKELNKIDLYLSELKKEKVVEERQSQKQTSEPEQEAFPIRIVGDSLLKIKNVSEESHANTKKKIKLSSQEVGFNDDEPSIVIGKIRCPLPPFKNEHLFCSAIFEYKAKEAVDWSVIYKKMKEDEPEKDQWRVVYDTLNAVNQRIREIANTEDNLFLWQEKTVKRLF